MGSWAAVIAFFADLFGTFATQVAYILMKKGMHKVENTGLNGLKARSGYLTCEWLSGFGLMMLGSFIHVIVLPFCDLVILSTITAAAIIMNQVMAVMYLKEKIVWKFDGPALLLILLGSILICALSSYSENSYTPDDIRELLWSGVTLAFFLMTAIFTGATIAQYIWHLRKLKSFNDAANKYLISMFEKMQGPGVNPKLHDLADKLISDSGETLAQLTSRERP